MNAMNDGEGEPQANDSLDDGEEKWMRECGCEGVWWLWERRVSSPVI